MKKKNFINAGKGDFIFGVVNAILMTMVVVITLYPILNTLAISLNNGIDSLRGGIYLIPRKFTLQNYTIVFKMENLSIGARNSIIRTVIGTVLQLSLTALLSYVLSIKEFVFRKQVSFFFVITLYVNGGLIPTFLLYKQLSLTNTFWVYIIPGLVSGFNLLVLRTYMNGLPDSLRESAQLDGAGEMTIFIRIIAPLCLPVFATIALFIAVYHWNSWFDTMLYNRLNVKLTTLQYELMKLLSSVTQQSGSAYSSGGNAAAVTPASTRASATIVTSVPIIILYPFLQRYFISGLTIGGVKE